MMHGQQNVKLKRCDDQNKHNRHTKIILCPLKSGFCSYAHRL